MLCPEKVTEILLLTEPTNTFMQSPSRHNDMKKKVQHNNNKKPKNKATNHLFIIHCRILQKSTQVLGKFCSLVTGSNVESPCVKSFCVIFLVRTFLSVAMLRKHQPAICKSLSLLHSCGMLPVLPVRPVLSLSVPIFSLHYPTLSPHRVA